MPNDIEFDPPAPNISEADQAKIGEFLGKISEILLPANVKKLKIKNPIGKGANKVFELKHWPASE